MTGETKKVNFAKMAACDQGLQCICVCSLLTTPNVFALTWMG